MKSLLAIILFISFMPLAGQVGSFDEMEFESDSARVAYKPSGKNYVLVKSKRGTSGMNKTPAADAILTAEVSEIVLVFSETDPASTADRAESIRERWENLLLTYPELFQFSTTYKNFCQCNSQGDAEVFKTTAGFYIYVNGEVPKVVEEPKAVATPIAVVPTETPKPVKTEEKKPVAETPPPAKAVPTPAKEVAPSDNTMVKTKELPPVPAVEKTEPTGKQQEAVKENTPPPAATTETEETTEVAKTTSTKKKPSINANKARKAKDPKACRPACYGWGDEDLQAFFKDNIPLTKKQRRKAKNWVANVKLQIHFDGVVKKEFVTGANEVFNTQVQDVLKRMNKWNAAVKNGTAVKTEVKFTLKYDKESKSIKAYDILTNPKATNKCPCVSDGEIFKD